MLHGISAQVITNTQCNTSERLCSIFADTVVATQTFNFVGTQNCMNNTTRLYYSFRANVAGSFTMVRYLTGTTTSTYKLYGPFTSFESGCNQINQLVSTPLVNQTTASTAQNVIANVALSQYYILEVTVNACSGSITVKTPPRMTNCSNDINCEDCIGSFQPTAGQYILSAWVKETVSNNAITTYTNSKIGVDAGGGLTWFTPSGQIIDGWQRIEGTFNANSVGAISLQLQALSNDVYFDDIRIFPYQGSMMSYVYDPITLRLVAELDERNYAKFYEYDEEGKLIRVKKETEKGIMTIQENRDNSSGL
jgi:hypothetical protein